MHSSELTRKSYAVERTYGKTAWRQLKQVVSSDSIFADFGGKPLDREGGFPKAGKQIPYRLSDEHLK